MIVYGWIFRRFVLLSELEGLLEEINRRPVRAFLVIDPPQSVSCIRRMRHAATSGLSKGECHVHITAGLEHHVGQVIRRQRVVRLEIKHCMVALFGAAPMM